MSAEEEKIDVGAAAPEEAAAAEETAAPAPKKKKNKKKKKKNKTANGKDLKGGSEEFIERSRAKQTDPPTIPVRKLFDSSRRNYPMGEHVDYVDMETRHSLEEARALERATCTDWIDDCRLGAEIHRQVRMNAQKNIRPGMLLREVAELVEDTARLLVEEKGLDAGLGFPCGTSINHCAAHYTANPGDEDVLQSGDVMKVDFGVHINGRIIDCAWTWCDDPVKQPLLDAVRAATNAGIAAAGIDVRLADIGSAIQEVMESYEVEIDGEVYPVQSVENLCGHSIEPYIIHAGKSVPIVGGRGGEYGRRMEEGEVFAIETFGTTGRGTVLEDGDCSHFMVEPGVKANIRLKAGRKLLNLIKQNFGTLAFCRRWISRLGMPNHGAALNSLVRAGIVNEYPPLMDVPGSFVAQYEHTILLKPTGKEIVSRGPDY